jgi:hypothetical protein
MREGAGCSAAALAAQTAAVVIKTNNDELLGQVAGMLRILT